jgi:large subunit ribosomal protein L13
MKTPSIRTEDAQRDWLLIDLDGQTVGRAAAQIASFLRGKHKPTFTPHTDTGDFVVCINADKVVFTGRKLTDKMYYRHSHYPGGLRESTAGQLLQRFPERVIRLAVKGMLPKNTLGADLLRKLKVYAGPEHPHAAQQPRTIQLG